MLIVHSSYEPVDKKKQTNTFGIFGPVTVFLRNLWTKKRDKFGSVTVLTSLWTAVKFYHLSRSKVNVNINLIGI